MYLLLFSAFLVYYFLLRFKHLPTHSQNSPAYFANYGFEPCLSLFNRFVIVDVYESRQFIDDTITLSKPYAVVDSTAHQDPTSKPIAMPGFAYSFSAIVIFIFVTVNFLFPCNRIFPLGMFFCPILKIQCYYLLLTTIIIIWIDRRTTSVIGAILCYFTRKVFFDDAINLLDAVNFDVMVMLSSIMIINHLVIHVKETKDVILYMQELVQRDPINGLWILSLAAFIASPFLTNDGVCLLFVEPILKAFEHIPHEYIPDATEDTTHMTLRKSDVIYFLLALACSANIGSALTYTGNPQNMIISSDALSVLPSYKFFLYMLPASMFSWIISKFILSF